MLKMIDLFPIWDKLLKKLDNDTNRKKLKSNIKPENKNLYFCRPVYKRPCPRNKSGIQVPGYKSDKIQFLFNQMVKNDCQLWFFK